MARRIHLAMHYTYELHYTFHCQMGGVLEPSPSDTAIVRIEYRRVVRTWLLLHKYLHWIRGGTITRALHRTRWTFSAIFSKSHALYCLHTTYFETCALDNKKVAKWIFLSSIFVKEKLIWPTITSSYPTLFLHYNLITIFL